TESFCKAIVKLYPSFEAILEQFSLVNLSSGCYHHPIFNLVTYYLNQGQPSHLIRKLLQYLTDEKMASYELKFILSSIKKEVPTWLDNLEISDIIMLFESIKHQVTNAYTYNEIFRTLEEFGLWDKMSPCQQLQLASEQYFNELCEKHLECEDPEYWYQLPGA